MKKYALKKKKTKLSRLWILIVVVIILLVVGIIADRVVYNNLLKPVNNSAISVRFSVIEGETAKQVSDSLNQKHLIKSSWAMQLYLHAKSLTDKLQAGTYLLSSNLSTPQIVEILTSGKINSDLITILPGQSIFQVRETLIKYGYSSSEVDYALNPSNYQNAKVFSFVPSGNKTLEGLLWPDSFARTATTPLTSIITESLNETYDKLTQNVQAGFAKEGLSVYQGITLASIINKEVSLYSDQTQVAQVFLTRLKNNTPLGSDVTANYGAIAAGKAPSLSYDSPYNTLLHTGLPPTPVSNLSDSSLKATINPAATNWLYFVTGDDGTTYFSTNYSDQQNNTALYCHKLCSLP